MSESIASSAEQAQRLNRSVKAFEDTLPGSGLVEDVVVASEWYRIRAAQQTALTVEMLDELGIIDEDVLRVVGAGIHKALNEGFRIGRRTDPNLPEVAIRTGQSFLESNPGPRTIEAIIEGFTS